jgi:endo-1,4-beta-D-glucanase Y
MQLTSLITFGSIGAIALALGCTHLAGSSGGPDQGSNSGTGSSGSSSSGSGGSFPTGSNSGNGGSGGTGSTSGSGGTAGSAGTTSTGGGTAGDAGGDGAASNPMGPTPPETGVMYPFPQNRHYANCTYPTYTNADVQAAYTTWKNTLVTTNGAMGYRRVARSAAENLPGHTVSEGIGYGMILAVYMNDQPLFDDLWHYEQKFLDGNGLMNWDIDPNGNVTGMNAATDADEDMAWALLQADKQWTTSPTLGAYLPIAKTQISKIWATEIYQSKLPACGDTWGDWNTLNISYFAPAYYRDFGAVDTADDWAATIKTTYDTITNNLNATNGNTTNGLVPGFSNSMGGPPATAGEPFYYQYDACRTPFRIGLDWCINGEPRAQAYVALTTSFFGAIGATKTVDGYQLNGSPMGTAPASPFVGPAGVGAMASASGAAFAQQAYSFLLTNPQQGGQYYAESWTALSLLMMSGNFLDYTHLP